MTQEKEPCLHVPYVIVIPYRVQVCDEISDGCKLYYGQLVPLAHKTGYLWATDRQLAEMKGTALRTIERYNSELEKAGFITRDTYNICVKGEDGSHSWVKKRKIYVNNAFASSMPEIEENLDESDSAKKGDSPDSAKKGDFPEADKKGGIISKSLDVILKKQSGVPDPVVISSSLEKLDIDTKLKIKICREYSEREIEVAVERCLRWKTRPNDEVGIMTPLTRAETWQDNVTFEEKTHSNSEYLRSLEEYDGKIIACTQIVICNKHVEFICGMKVVVFETNKPDFKQKVSNYLDYLKKTEESKREVTREELDEILESLSPSGDYDPDEAYAEFMPK